MEKSLAGLSLLVATFGFFLLGGKMSLVGTTMILAGVVGFITALFAVVVGTRQTVAVMKQETDLPAFARKRGKVK